MFACLFFCPAAARLRALGSGSRSMNCQQLNVTLIFYRNVNRPLRTWAEILLLYTPGYKQCARNNHYRRL